jgi:hypothetical protein
LGDHITEEFVEENLDLFLSLKEGGQVAYDAWDKITKKSGEIGKEVAKSMGATEEQIAAIDAAIAALPEDANFQLTGSADLAPVLEGLSVTEKQAAAIAAYLESLGWITEWTISGYEGPNGEIPIYTGKIVSTGKGGALSDAAPKGGGGGGGDKKDWENPYDKLYNL